MYPQHEEYELVGLDLQAAIKISGADDLVVMLGQAELELAQDRSGKAVPLLFELLNKKYVHIRPRQIKTSACPDEAVA